MLRFWELVCFVILVCNVRLMGLSSGDVWSYSCSGLMVANSDWTLFKRFIDNVKGMCSADGRASDGVVTGNSRVTHKQTDLLPQGRLNYLAASRLQRVEPGFDSARLDWLMRCICRGNQAGEGNQRPYLVTCTERQKDKGKGNHRKIQRSKEANKIYLMVAETFHRGGESGDRQSHEVSSCMNYWFLYFKIWS